MVHELIFNLVYFFLACAALVISGSWTVRSLTKIAKFLKLSEFFTSFLLMATATSLPELFVGISAALNDKGGLAIGTVIGSNIIDLTLIAGIAILLVRNIKLKNKTISKSAWWMVGISTLPVILFIIGNKLSRMDGLILILTFFFCMYKIYSKHQNNNGLKNGIKSPWEILFTPVIFVLSILALYISADFTVLFASNIAIYFNLPYILIGLFIISLGTSLPELIFETRALFSGFQELALGDLIGSVVANSTLVLGVAALINPLSANFVLFMTSSVFMIIIAFIFATFLEIRQGFSWKEGIALILLFILFVLLELTVKGIIPAASILV